MIVGSHPVAQERTRPHETRYPLRLDVLRMTPALVLILAALLAAAGQLLLKHGARAGGSLPAALRSPQILGALLCFGTCLPLVVWALRQADFSFYYATTALNYVFVILLSRPLLGESLDRRKLIGSALIVTGVVLYGW